MRIETTGTARIRHSGTGEIFDIEAEELDWDSVGGSERQMGPETEYAAEVHHPDLGEMVWRLWEYPVGAENYQAQELNGHELVKTSTSVWSTNLMAKTSQTLTMIATTWPTFRPTK